MESKELDSRFRGNDKGGSGNERNIYMKSIVKILVLIVVVWFSFGLYLFIERVPAYQKVSQIKVGMTRGDLQKSFEQDGGIQGVYISERYVLKNYKCHDYETPTYSITCLLNGRMCWAGKAIKIRVSFHSANSDSKWGDPRDKIVGISEPFCEWVATD